MDNKKRDNKIPPTKSPLLIFLVLSIVATIALNFVTSLMLSPKKEEISYDEFLVLVDKDKVDEVVFENDKITIYGIADKKEETDVSIFGIGFMGESEPERPIYYTGYIMETYPAQINTDKISVQGYEGFEITVKEADKVEGITILNNKDLYKNNSDFNLNYYGLNEVNVKVDDQEMSLEGALESGKITLDGIIAKANKDFPSVICYEDGESMEYHYDTYTIIKCHTLDGNRDVWIGIPQMTLNSIN